MYVNTETIFLQLSDEQEDYNYILSLPTNSTYDEWSLIGSSCQHIHHWIITRDNFLLTVHLITAFSSIFNIFAVYCILVGSGTTMGVYKWCLLNLQFWIIFTDIWVAVLGVPRFYFPVIGGRSYGILFTLGFTIPQLLYCGCGSLGGMIASVFVLFLFRHQAVVHLHSKFKFSTKIVIGFILFNYFIYTNMMFPVVLTSPLDQIKSKIEILKIESCPPKDILDPDVFVVQFSYDSLLPYAIFILLLVGSECSLLAIHSSWCIFFSTLLQNLSKKTRQMQKRFILALIAQIAIPTALCYAPIFYCLGTTLMDHYNQFANDVCVFVFATHGMISSICVILFYDCYRNYLKAMIRRYSIIKRIEPSTIHSENISTTRIELTLIS